MKIPQIDLKAQYETIQQEVDQAISEVLASSQFIRGKAVEEFEEAFAPYCHSSYSVGVGNGTDALMLALKAVGISQGDEVITTPFTFAATVEAIHWAGAKIVFVDINTENYTIDIEQIEEKITARTRAIIPVHLYGHSADMESILELAREYDLKIIEDAAQAHGALYKGKRVGSFGIASTFSFYPGKNLGAYGDGGAVVTNDVKVADNVRKLADHGCLSKYEHEQPGFNSRLDSIQAAVLNVKLKYIDDWTTRRREIARFYNEVFAQIPEVITPEESSWAEAVYHLYVVQVSNRDIVKQKLNAAGIGAGIHYPIALHLQKAYGFLNLKKGSYPVSEKAAESVLSLPNYPEMSDEMVEFVAGKVKEFARQGSR